MSTSAASRSGTGVVSIAAQVEAIEDVYCMLRDETSCKRAILVLLADGLNSSEGGQSSVGYLFSIFSDAVHIKKEHPSCVLLQLHGS